MSSKKHNYGIVGDGRVAKHMMHYFDLLGISYRQWSRRLQNLGCCDSPSSTFAECERILLLISDSVIPAFIAEHSVLSTKVVIHFSGCLVLDNAYSAHPLICFTPDFFPAERYQQIPFFIESNRLCFNELLPGLNNPHYEIPQKLKPLYHALCVASGNFTVLLWQEVFAMFQQQLNLPAETLHFYLEQTTANLLKNPEAALTGPLQRNDYLTIQKNLASLDGYPIADVYHSFINFFENKKIEEIQ